MTSAIDQLMGLPRYAIDGTSAIHPGFERIEALLSAMNHPEKGRSFALVAGTNGKGSVSSMMASILTANGIRTGLHTSPHLLHVSERMRVDGTAPSKVWLENRCAQYNSLFQSTGASFFEATFALSLLWFAEQKTTHVVVEVGLGGRLDATNVLKSDISLIVGVALDHTDILGNSIAKIAVEKAGIIKRGKPVVLGTMKTEAKRAITSVARSKDAPLWVASDYATISEAPGGTIDIQTEDHFLASLSLQLKGRHQYGNVATALVALKQWVPGISVDAIREGLEHTARLSGLRARAEIVRTNPILMVDVGHNPDAMGHAFATFFEVVDRDISAESTPSCIVIGLMADKDITRIGHMVSQFNLPILTVPIHGGRGLTEFALQHAFSNAGVQRVHPFSSVQSALNWVGESQSNCLVLGSHMVAAEALSFVFDR